MTTAEEQPQEASPVQAEEPSVWWAVAFGGLLLFFLGWFVVYETLTLFAAGSADWMACIRTDDLALSGCADQMNMVFDYRYGLDALQGLGVGLFVIFIGPIPMIAMLRRYKNNIIGFLLFFLIMFPYGLLAFLILLIGMFILMFYGIELT